MTRKKYVTIGVVARAVQLSKSTVLRAAKAGKFKGFLTPGGHYRLNLQEAKAAIRKMGGI